MALDALFDGTIVDGAESTVNWFEDGALPAPESWSEVLIQGLASNGTQSSSKDGVMGYDYSATGSFDFTPGTGAHEGQHIFMWVNMTTKGTMALIEDALPGLSIRLYSGTAKTDYAEWVIAGSDNYDILSYGTNGFTLIVLDPTTTPTTGRSGGTFDISNVSQFGVWVSTNSSSRADNLFIDQIGVGWGLKITGTTVSEAWAEVLADDMGTSTNTWGILQGTAGSELLAHGRIKIGDDVGTLATDFFDQGKAIKFISQQYYTGTTGVYANMVADDFLGIEIVDNATGSTQFEDGVLVGSDQGRSGSKFEGSDLHASYFNASLLTHASSTVKCYNTTFKKMSGGISYHGNANSLLYGATVDQSGQFDPVSSPMLRNITFSGTVDTYSVLGDGSALLWNDNINIQKCSFIANTHLTVNPHAIEHILAGTYTYTDLLFSGNDFDIHFVAATGDLIINASGTTDASTFENLSTGIVTINNSKSLTFTGIPDGVETRIRQGSFSIFHEQDSTGGTVSYAYNYSGDEKITVIFSGAGIIATKRLSLILGASDQTIPMVFELDPSYLP